MRIEKMKFRDLERMCRELLLVGMGVLEKFK